MADEINIGLPGPTGEPQRITEAAVDEKGRWRIPGDFARYLTSFGGKKLFITSLDKRLGLVYPDSVWQQNMELLRTSADPETAKRISFRAQAHGDEVEIDDAGRALLPANFRKALGITGKTEIWLHAFNGCVRIMTPPVYEQEMSVSDEKFPADSQELNRIRFK